MTRRVRQLRATATWTDEHRDVLLSGHDYFWAFRLDEPMTVPTRSREGWDEIPEVEARLRAVVADLGDEILAEWIEKKPFSRPWFWWRFFAPERRRCLTGQHRYDRPEYAAWPHRLFLGVPADALPPHFGAGEEYETERDYLIRLDLITADEQKITDHLKGK